MYRCGKCTKVVSGNKPVIKILDVKSVTYPFRSGVNTTWDGRVKDDPGGEGYQITKETLVCFGCYEEERKTLEASA